MPIEFDKVKKMERIGSGSTSAKNVDWDLLREDITGNELAYTTKDILDLTKEYSLIVLTPVLDKSGDERFDEEGFPLMNSPITQMRARDFLVKEWQKGRALRFKTYESGKGIRIYYVFPMRGGVGKVRNEEGAHPEILSGKRSPEPKVTTGVKTFEEEMLQKHREAKRKKKEKILNAGRLNEST